MGLTACFLWSVIMSVIPIASSEITQRELLFRLYPPLKLLYQSHSFEQGETIIFTKESNNWAWRASGSSDIRFSTPLVMITPTFNGPRVHQASIFDRDLFLSELLHPLKFGHLRFTPQRSFAVFECSTTKTLTAMIDKLATEKLVKANRDIFIFYGRPETLNKFTLHPLFNNIAFKYFIYHDGFDQHPATRVLNHCRARSTVNYLLWDNNDCKMAVAGKVLRAAAITGAQWYEYENNADGSLKKARGIYHFMFQECSRRLNFTMRVHSIAGSGSKPNGTWNGGVGDLVTRKADLVFPLGIVEARNFAVDYSNLLTWFERVFWVRPSPKKPTTAAIIKPLDPVVWLFTLCTILLMIPTLYLLIRNEHRKQSGGEPASLSHMLGYVMDIIIRMLLEQSTALRDCNGLYTRLGILLLAIFSILVSNSYRSKLFFFLTFNEGDAVPRMHAELAYSDYKLVFRFYGGVAYRHVETSNDPVHLAMLRDGRLRLEKTSPGCIQRVLLEDRAACMDYSFSGEYAILANATLYNKGTSDELLKRSVDVDGKFIVSWGFKKGSPLVKIINGLIKQFQAAGLYDHWLRRDWTEAKLRGIRHLRAHGDPQVVEKLEQLERDADTGATPLNLGTLAVPFLLDVLGGLAALLAFLTEVTCERLLTKEVVRSISIRPIVSY